MSEFVRVLGVDPSLRNTGLAIVEYNTEKTILENDAFRVTDCQVMQNPNKYKGTAAILNMLDMLEEDAYIYNEVDWVVIESPPIMFNKNWSQGTMSSIAHVAGGCAPIFGLDKSFFFRPSEWNSSRKKEVTHAKTQAILGDYETWEFEKKPRSEKMKEHILDAASMALWYIKSNYLED